MEEHTLQKVNFRKLCNRSRYFALLRKYDKLGQQSFKKNRDLAVAYPSCPQGHCLYFSFQAFCAAISFLGNAYSTSYPLQSVCPAELVNVSVFLGSDCLLDTIMRHILDVRSSARVLVALANNFGLNDTKVYEVCKFITDSTGIKHAKILSLIQGKQDVYITRHLYRSIRSYSRVISRFWSHHKPDTLCMICGDVINYGSPHFKGSKQKYMFMDCCFILVHRDCGLEYTTKILCFATIDDLHEGTSLEKECPECKTVYRDGQVVFQGPFSVFKRNQARTKRKVDLDAVSPCVTGDWNQWWA